MQEARDTIELDPNYDQTHILLGRVYQQKGMFDEAAAEFRKAMSLSEGLPGPLASLGHTYAISGKSSEARKVLKQLHEIARRRHVSPFLMATVHVGLREQDAALEWIEKAYQMREGSVRLLKVDPRFDVLKKDPRFQDVLRRAGLAGGSP